MKKKGLKVLLVIGFAGLLLLGLFKAPPQAQAAEEIQWWHAMGGKLGEKVEGICSQFNASNSEVRIIPVYKGNYTETMTAAIAAFRSKTQPHIVQVFEVGTASMMAAEGAIKPVYKLMEETGIPFDQSKYLSAVVGYYTTPEGKMLSMPFNSSTPVVYYNKDAFRKAGLDPEKPPRTWPELGEACRAIIAAGATKYGFTSGWQSWVQLENLGAWHNLPFASKANGFEGFDTEFLFNSPQHVKHIQQLADWQKENIFKYGGRRGDCNPLFYNGEAAMLMNSSAYYGEVTSTAKFDFGVAMLPYWPEIKGAPQNSIIGGATLWVMAGHDNKAYKAVAEFFRFLSRAEVQADWHQSTGYLPITHDAYTLSQQQGYYTKNPGSDMSIKQLTLNPPTANSKGLRLGNFVQIRDIINNELEAVWSGQKNPQEALDAAVKEGNILLRRFEKTMN
jgi:sn-glycerol 3-phosphate transport system substrate-binding protein